MFNPKTHALTDKSLPGSTPKLYHLQNILFIFENRMSIKFNRHLKAQHKNHTGLFHQFKVSFTGENCVIFSLSQHVSVF